MKVETISAIERVPLAVDYRRMYRGSAQIVIGTMQTAPCPIEFVLEMSPLGTHEVSITFLGPTDYPTIPALQVLKQYISDLDRRGALP